MIGVVGDAAPLICDMEGWIQGEWHRCIFNPTTSIIGDGLWGLIVGGAVWMSLYVAGGGKPTAPTVVTLLFSGMLFPILPASKVGAAWSVLLVGAAAVCMQAIQKYVLNPQTL